MNWNQFNGILRAVVPAAVAYAVGRGWVASSMEADLVAAISTIIAAIWSVKTNKV